MEKPVQTDDSLEALVDTQSKTDYRGIMIDKVGVKDIVYPIRVLDRRNNHQDTTARISMSVSLPHHFKGTHMSRFLEILNDHRGQITYQTIAQILDDMKERLEAEVTHIEVFFDYFMEKQAPVTGAGGMMNYACAFIGTTDKENHHEFVLQVGVPVMTLCPCSKAMSQRNAHNQRSIVTIQIMSSKLVWIEDLVAIAEESASSPLYSVLKRPDEKFVTDFSYDNPRFVEDVVREVALRLNERKEIEWYRVESDNYESIHNHNAYAMVEKHGKRPSHLRYSL